MLKHCNLPADTVGWTLDKFDAYHPDLKLALAAAKEIAKPEGGLKWLTLSGGVDVGKSHLSVAICREWLRHDMPARYSGVPSLLDSLRNTYTTGGEFKFENLMHFYQNVPLLVLDDLSVEKATEWGFEKLYQIVNSRSEGGLHLVVTTNRPLDNLRGDDEKRIASRLMRHRQGKVIVINAPEYRLRSAK